MAHKRKDTYVAPIQWWKHLKWCKKLVNRLERKAAAKRIKAELSERGEEDGEIQSSVRREHAPD